MNDTEEMKNEIHYFNPLDKGKQRTFSIDEEKSLEKEKKPRKIKERKQERKQERKPDISYSRFIRKEISLSSYKIIELKKAAKSFKLHITGTKPVLIQRIQTYFNKMTSAIVIQKNFRRWIVQFYFQLHGPALRNRSLCVNDTDFVTMEPLNEIPDEQFFSYTDEKHFTYGFNVASLIQLIQQKAIVHNPYNREKISSILIYKIITFYKLSCILYESFREENPSFDGNPRSIYRVINAISNIVPIVQEEHHQPELITDYMPQIQNMHILLDGDNYQRYQKINQIRLKTMNQRIQELFMEMDQLGNYTQSEWFNQLDIRGFTRLYRYLFDIWNYRSQMTYELKMKICPFYSPFEGVIIRQNVTIDFQEIKVACLIVMENMTYLGVDEDHRKIGVFHALSALTIVSHGARMAMPWLYESVVF
jgi:hypothetical protein